MALFGTGAKRVNTQQPQPATSLRVQTSILGKPIAIGWGTVRVPGNLIWYNDFEAISHQSAPASGGGKGGGGSVPGSVTYTYKVAVIFGIAEGPASVTRVWNNKTAFRLSELNFGFESGGYSQLQQPYVLSTHPGEALAYRGITLTIAGKFDLGDNQELPNFSWEVQFSNGRGAHLDGENDNPDAEPWYIVRDTLTNPHYGVDFPAERIGDFSVFFHYCRANGIVLSPVLNEQTPVNSFLDEVMRICNSEFVWSSGKLNIVPYGDQNISANSATYFAPSAPIYSVGEDDYQENQASLGGVGDGEAPPVVVSRKRPADVTNSIKVQYLNRGNDYNQDTAQAKNEAFINAYGLRPGDPRQHHMLCKGVTAVRVAHLMLGREGVLNTYGFTLDASYILLDPMDVIAINDTELGLIEQWVRIKEITENSDRTLSFVAEEFLFGTGHAPVYGTEASAGHVPNYNQDPGKVNAPILFEPPAPLATSAGQLELWAAVSGQNKAVWGGAEVWVSQDGDTYRFIDRIIGGSRTGSLMSLLPAVAVSNIEYTLDVTNPFNVDLTECNGELISASDLAFRSLNTLCYVDGEFIAYRDAIPIAANKYRVSTLLRGVYASPITDHHAGARFTRLDGSIFKWPFTPDKIGRTVYVKFLSFNIWGGGLQSLDQVPAAIYTFKGTALAGPPDNVEGLTTTFVAGILQLIWDPVPDTRDLDYEVRYGDSLESASILGFVNQPRFPTAGDGTYWVRAHYKIPNGPDVYSITAASVLVAGSQLSANVVEEWDEGATGWAGTKTLTRVDAGNLVLAPSGDILDDEDILVTVDINEFNGVVSEGIYQIDTSHQIDVGYVTDLVITISLGSLLGYAPFSSDIVPVIDVLSVNDILGIALGEKVSVIPQIALSQDGSTFGDWQTWSPGTYRARKVDARLIMRTTDPQVVPRLGTMILRVDVPDRVDRYTNVSILAGGTTITFRPEGAGADAPFNGGPNAAIVPNIQVTIRNAQQGDTVNHTTSLSATTIQILNGGVGVARTVDVLAQGY